MPELGINFIDTADSYGPDVSEPLIKEALRPYRDGLVVATKGGLTRGGPGKVEYTMSASVDYLQRARRDLALLDFETLRGGYLDPPPDVLPGR